MKSAFIWLRANYWRFTPDSWGDWARFWYFNTLDRFHSWRFWYSPPWRKTYRCPSCAGSGVRSKYGDSFPCDQCQGAKFIPKYPGYGWPYWALKLRWRWEEKRKKTKGQSNSGQIPAWDTMNRF